MKPVALALTALLLLAAGCPNEKADTLRAEIAKLKEERVETIDRSRRRQQEAAEAEAALAATLTELEDANTEFAKREAERDQTRAAIDAEIARNARLRGEIDAVARRAQERAARGQELDAQIAAVRERATWVRDQAAVLARELRPDDVAWASKRRLDSLAEFSERVAKEYADDPVAAEVARQAIRVRCAVRRAGARRRRTGRATPRSLCGRLRAAVARGRGGRERSVAERTRCGCARGGNAVRRARRIAIAVVVLVASAATSRGRCRFRGTARGRRLRLARAARRGALRRRLARGAPSCCAAASRRPSGATRCATVRDGFGAVASRRVASKDYHRQIEGGPDGDYFTLRIVTSLADGREVVEVVTLTAGADQQYRTAAYGIKR